jgi:hypothetical protein
MSLGLRGEREKVIELQWMRKKVDKQLFLMSIGYKIKFHLDLFSLFML